jgi:choline-sulfatase
MTLFLECVPAVHAARPIVILSNKSWSGGMPNSAPNILLVMADQLAPQFLPAYGHNLVKTPHIDGICERGIVFDAAYTNSPLCAPSRYSMMAGCLPSSIAAWDNAAELSAEVPTFAHYLSGLGYHTCLSGKMHFCGPDQLHGFETRSTTDVYPADFTWTPDWDAPDKVHEWFHTMDVVKEAGACIRSNNLDYDDEVTFQARRYLYDRARNGDGRPFCLVVSYIHPHDPYITRPEYWFRYDEDDIEPPTVGASDVPTDAHSARIRAMIGIDTAELTHRQVVDARRAYFGSISYVDEQVGALLAALRECGFWDHTVVLFTADHGDMLGERGLWFKMSWFEHSARVPLVIAFPSAFPTGRSAQAVSLIDLLPTMVDLATDGRGLEFQCAMDGRSLVPQLSGSSGHDEAAGQYLAELTTEPIFMIRKANRKFVLSDGDAPMYFDMRRDPRELINLAEDPAHQAAVAGAWMEVRSRWDIPGIRARVLESQRRRRTVTPALVSQGVSWDHAPRIDASRCYIRNNLELYEIERRSRFPPIE